MASFAGALDLGGGMGGKSKRVDVDVKSGGLNSWPVVSGGCWHGTDGTLRFSGGVMLLNRDSVVRISAQNLEQQKAAGSDSIGMIE